VNTPSSAYPFLLPSPSVLSRSVLSPSVLSRSVLSRSVLSPSVLSPSVLSPSVLSPSVLSEFLEVFGLFDKCNQPYQFKFSATSVEVVGIARVHNPSVRDRYNDYLRSMRHRLAFKAPVSKR